MSEIASLQNALETPGRRPIGRRTVLKGLLWREALAHGRILMIFAALWVVGVWVLELFFHPGVVLVFGGVYTVLVGPLVGGSDAAEGAEEFSFALPPVRGDRYLVRLAVGLGPLLIFQGVGLAAIGLDWPQALWGLVVESGLADPFQSAEGYWYAIAFSVPVTAFALTFVAASLMAQRRLVMFAWVAGAVGALAVLGIAIGVEHALWDRPTGLIVGPVLPAAAALTLLGGYLAYQRKEGVARAAGAGASWATRGLIAALAAVVALGVLSLLWWTVEPARQSHRLEAQRQVLDATAAADPAERRVVETQPSSATSTASAPASQPAGQQE